MNQNKLVIQAIQTEDGLYIKKERLDYYTADLNGFFFDGNLAQPTFHTDWYKIAKKPERIYRLVNQPNINYRFELIDKSLESEKFPLSFKFEEVAEKGEYGYSDPLWNENTRHLSSLYELKSDTQPHLEEDIEFEFKIILVVDNIKEYQDFCYSYKGERSNWDGKHPTINVTAKSITHQVIDKIIFPEPFLPSRPCSLSSKDTYGIIREYIKNNINPKAAEITSDYDFCFTVKKKIKLPTPYESKHEFKTSRGKSYRPPRVKKTLTENKMVEVFEMTHDERKYQGYTVVEGFRGNNQEDLKNNIDAYLEELITYINIPLEECSCCKGVGMVDIKEENK